MDETSKKMKENRQQEIIKKIDENDRKIQGVPHKYRTGACWAPQNMI